MKELIAETIQPSGTYALRQGTIVRLLHADLLPQIPDLALAVRPYAGTSLATEERDLFQIVESRRVMAQVPAPPERLSQSQVMKRMGWTSPDQISEAEARLAFPHGQRVLRGASPTGLDGVAVILWDGGKVEDWAATAKRLLGKGLR